MLVLRACGEGPRWPVEPVEPVEPSGGKKKAVAAAASVAALRVVTASPVKLSLLFAPLSVCSFHGEDLLAQAEPHPFLRPRFLRVRFLPVLRHHRKYTPRTLPRYRVEAAQPALSLMQLVRAA